MAAGTDETIQLDGRRAADIAKGLRAHGLLASRSDEDVQAAFASEWPDGVEATPWSAELLVAAMDVERVLHRDAECDPFPRNRAYVAWVEAFADISRGALEVTRVEERWLADPSDDPTHHPVEILVETPRGRAVFRPFQAGDYVHPDEIAAALNTLMPLEGPRFWLAPTGGQDALAIALTGPEKGRLESERGWRFHDPVAAPMVDEPGGILRRLRRAFGRK